MGALITINSAGGVVDATIFDATLVRWLVSIGCGYEAKDGCECHHTGCRNHVLHPCEECGRVMAQGSVFVAKYG